MFDQKFTGIFLIIAVMCLGGVGCVMNKKKQTAADTTPPPPAAYPPGSGDAAAGAAGSSSSDYSGASSSQRSASHVTKPRPFELMPGEQLVIYQIGSGDTLGAIAKKYRTTTSRIMAANGMTDTTIYAGKTIKVPTASSSGAGGNATAPPVIEATGYSSDSGSAPVTQTQTPRSATQQSSQQGSSGSAATGYNQTVRTATTSNYIGPANDPGLPSVSTYSAGGASSTGDSQSTISPVPATQERKRESPSSSGAAFPTPSFSSGN